MADTKRNKKQIKIKEPKRPIILIKKNEKEQGSEIPKKDDQIKKSNDQIQPKILLKAKGKDISLQNNEIRKVLENPRAGAITIQTKEKEVSSCNTVTKTITKVNTPDMVISVPLISGNEQVNLQVSKFLIKSNTNFFVIGVIGAQGVGKTTLLNLLTDEEETNINCDFFLRTENCAFSYKNKTEKRPTKDFTDNIKIFITKSRHILLDCPPILCSCYNRNALSNESYDIKMINFLFEICHLVLVVQDDFFNLNILRLLQLAQLIKPNNDNKLSMDYYPHILFIKNKAKRNDFEKRQNDMHIMIEQFSRNSKLELFKNIRVVQKNTNNKMCTAYEWIDYFTIPYISDEGLTPYCSNIQEIVLSFRNRVLMSPRKPMSATNTEITETIWFEIVIGFLLNTSFFFLNLYDQAKRSLTESSHEFRL